VEQKMGKIKLEGTVPTYRIIPTNLESGTGTFPKTIVLVKTIDYFLNTNWFKFISFQLEMARVT